MKRNPLTNKKINEVSNLTDTLIKQPDMFTERKLRSKSLEDIKTTIKSAGIVKNENNVRLWWKEGKKTQSITIAYDIPELLKSAAEVLKECVLVDDYEVFEINREVIRVNLKINEYYEYKAGDKNVCVRVPKVLDWREIELKYADVLEIANLLIYKRCTAGRPLGKVINLFPRNTSTKNAA